MTTLALPVDEEIRAAYEAATEDEREHWNELAQSLLRGLLNTPEERLARFRKAADAVSAEAARNGWTEELDKQLLRGNFKR